MTDGLEGMLMKAMVANSKICIIQAFPLTGLRKQNSHDICNPINPVLFELCISCRKHLTPVHKLSKLCTGLFYYLKIIYEMSCF
jgi:hypothetical protein